MLDILVNGEKLSRTQFNDSASKQHYSFGRCKRFRVEKQPFDTEYNYEVCYDLATPALTQKEVCMSRGAKRQPFNSSSSRIAALLMPAAPPPDTYNPRLLAKARSCSFGVGREVR